jgi:adenylate cyclase
MTGQRRLAAILVADVVGYSMLIGSDEAGTLAELQALWTNVIEPQISEHAGRLFKSVGDGFLVEFASAVQAANCAKAIQEANSQGRLPLRIGIHVGDVVVQGDDLMGDGVNVAARIEGVAEPGGIAISRAVHEQVRDKLDFDFIDKGEIALKNIQRPMQIFVIAGAKVDKQATALPLPDKPSIAVLPFDNMSGDPEQAYFADGLADDLITSLSRVSWLFVIARNSSFALRGEKLDARSIGRRLGARYLVEGSVRRAGQRLRLGVQLIDAVTGNHLWADKHDGSLEDVFDFQDQVVGSLVGAIVPQLRASEIERARQKRPESLDAFDLYLRALPKLAAFSPGGIDDALELLGRSVSLSPNYAQALAHAALCHAVRPVQGHSPDQQQDLREAAELARRALDADATDPLGLSITGFLAALLHRDYEGGCDLVDRSLTINRNDALSWTLRGWINAWAGETDMAIADFAHAMRLSPLDPHWGGNTKAGMANALCWAGRDEEALRWARRAFQDRPDWSVTRRMLIGALWLSGLHLEAKEVAKNYVAMFPGFSLRQARAVIPLRGTPGQKRYFEALALAGLPE